MSSLCHLSSFVFDCGVGSLLPLVALRVKRRLQLRLSPTVKYRWPSDLKGQSWASYSLVHHNEEKKTQHMKIHLAKRYSGEIYA